MVIAMKKIISIFAAILAVVGCQKYEFNTDFTMPTTLDGPSSVTLDVTSTETVILTWEGGGAADGGIMLYEVLFDKVGGDFSNPVYTSKSDLGSRPQLTLSHAILNNIARKAGIKPNETGKVIWTVKGAKGGESKLFDGSCEIALTRGEGIDNIPERLYIQGTGAKEAGQQFAGYDYIDGGKVYTEEGKYVIYTEVGIGKISFSSEADGSGNTFYIDESGKLVEGEGGLDILAAPESGLARITVDFNTLGYSMDEIGKSVGFKWGATATADSDPLFTLEYQGNGIFVGDGDVDFYGPGTNMEDNPSWCSWVEERFYFIATVNGESMCWGSSTGGNAVTPDGTDEYWYVFENPWDQWSNLWKMDHAFDDCHVTVTLNTNNNGHFTHGYVGGAIEYQQPTEAPESLILGGDAAEQQGMQFRKEADGVFVIYNKFKAGNITLVDGEGTKYFANAENALYVGNKKSSVAASEGVTRMTVNFNTNTVKYEAIGAEVYVENAWDKIVMATLTYQGLGKWAGEGEIQFAASGDERFSFRTTVDGVNMRWGSNKGNDGTAPDGTDEFWYIYESEWEGQQWNNLYKFNKDDKGKTATFIIDGNNPVHMTHSITVASGDPVKPSVAPAELALYGTGAETEGAAFRKAADGVFVIYARLKEGTLSFRSSSKNYFNDAEQGLLEGDGEGVATASDEGYVSRITVDFANGTVTVDKVNEYTHLKLAGTFRDVAHLKYNGNGIFKATDAAVKFIDQAEASWVTWGAEERFYFITEINGTEMCWGMAEGAVHNDLKYNNDESFWKIQEYTWSQWDHCWKLAGDLNGATIDVEVNTNDNGNWTYTITKK